MSLQIAERIGSRNSLAIALRALGAAHALAGAWDDAAQVFEDAASLVRREGTLLQMESDLIANLGAARLGAGDPKAALEPQKRRSRSAHDNTRGFRSSEATWSQRRRGWRRAASAPGEIAHGLDVASRIVEESGASAFRAADLRIAAELALQLGKAAEFRSELERARALHRRMGAEAHRRRIEERLQRV